MLLAQWRIWYLRNGLKCNLLSKWYYHWRPYTLYYSIGTQLFLRYQCPKIFPNILISMSHFLSQVFYPSQTIYSSYQCCFLITYITLNCFSHCLIPNDNMDAFKEIFFSRKFKLCFFQTFSVILSQMF